MDNLILSFNVVAPMLLMMILGVVLNKLGILSEATLKELNTLTYKVFIPLSLFCNVYTGDLEGMMKPRPILFAMLCLTVAFAVTMILFAFCEPVRNRRGVLVQAVIRSNFVIFGIPVASALLGDGNLGVVSLMVVILSPYYNLLSVIALSVFGESKASIKKTLVNIITNPIIIASLTAIVFLLLHIPIPEFLLKTVKSLGAIASPLAFIVLGGTFVFKMDKSMARSVFIGVLGRLIVMPIIFIPISIALGFRGDALVGLLALFGAPTAVASYPLATHMGGDGETASKIIVYSSLFSVLTMFLLIFALKQLNYL